MSSAESSTPPNTDPASNTTSGESSSRRVSLGRVGDLPLDEMTMVNADGTRLTVIRTKSGVHAIDNACPHQGYGLATGALTVNDDGTPIVTCQWHNWKFRGDTGECVVGEEDVACHLVTVDADGEATVEIVTPSAAEQRERLWPSLRRGVESDYVGQIARDVARLVVAEADPVDIMFVGVEPGAARNEWGLGHQIALAADCLTVAGEWATTSPATDVALALTQALAGISEEIQGHPARELPQPGAAELAAALDAAGLGSVDRGPAGGDASAWCAAVVSAIEAEHLDSAVALTVAGLDAGLTATDLLPALVASVGAHHLDYGHGAIYLQKVYELLEHASASDPGSVPERTRALLPHLVVTIANGTREDVLPYMRGFVRELDMVDLDALSTFGHQRAWSAERIAELAETFVNADAPPLPEAVDALRSGAGVDGLLDAVSLAVSHRMLRHDTTRDFAHIEHREPFTWLDITHGLTYANAGRWVWANHPGTDALRLALLTVWLMFDTGRHERHVGITEPRTDDEPQVAAALSGERDAVYQELMRAAMDDRAGSFIVAAHLVKTSLAAREEAATIGSNLPLAAAARFVHGPRRERFVARAAAEAHDFVVTGRPPTR